jgi:hypothetical protein
MKGLKICIKNTISPLFLINSVNNIFLYAINEHFVPAQICETAKIIFGKFGHFKMEYIYPFLVTAVQQMMTISLVNTSLTENNVMQAEL